MTSGRIGVLASGLTLAVVWGCLGSAAKAPAAVTADAQTQAIVTATSAFLSLLSAEQRAKVQFPFVPLKTSSAAEFKGGMNGRMTFVGEQYGHAVWSNYPVSDVPRPGLRLGSLSSAQRDAAMHLLQVVLSSKGYRKVIDIMGSDEVLSSGGTPFSSGTAYYTMGIFGAPSPTTAWMLEFGGHHLGLNVTISGNRGIITPTLTGAQPALYTSGGKTVRVLAQENDKAFALLNALEPAQRKQ